jgi:hypothetical protein
MTTKIISINNEYFGEDKTKTYLKDDFSSVLHSIVQRSVILEVFLEASKARHNKEERANGAIAYGDFDPDNAGFLSNIFYTYQKGWMVDVRQLLVSTESGAGGKFIKDTRNLTAHDFMDFYKNSKSGSVSIPNLLLSDFINKHSEDKSISGADFINSHREDIEKTVSELVTKAQQLHSKDYFKKVIYDYQALEFHKDKQPAKYTTREEAFDFPFGNGKHTIRRRKSKLEIRSIGEFLNDFAEIVMIYQSLVGKTSFIGSNHSLDVYINRTFALFSKSVPEDARAKVFDEVVKYLDKSLHLVGWDHRKTAISVKKG